MNEEASRFTIESRGFPPPWRWRDLGGKGRVRPGRVYRSARLDRYESSVLRPFLAEKQIRTVVDLRNDQDLLEHHYESGALEGIRYVNLQFRSNYRGPPDVLSPVERLREIYLTVIDDPAFPGWVSGLLEEISGPGNLPLVFHCDEGAHRTGMLAAMLLNLAEATDREIVDDYLITAGQVREEYIEALLIRLRSEGGARRYLISEGLPESLIDRAIEGMTAQSLPGC